MKRGLRLLRIEIQVDLWCAVLLSAGIVNRDNACASAYARNNMRKNYFRHGERMLTQRNQWSISSEGKVREEVVGGWWLWWEERRLRLAIFFILAQGKPIITKCAVPSLRTRLR